MDAFNRFLNILMPCQGADFLEFNIRSVTTIASCGVHISFHRQLEGKQIIEQQKIPATERDAIAIFTPRNPIGLNEIAVQFNGQQDRRSSPSTFTPTWSRSKVSETGLKTCWRTDSFNKNLHIRILMEKGKISWIFYFLMRAKSERQKRLVIDFFPQCT